MGGWASSDHSMTRRSPGIDEGRFQYERGNIGRYSRWALIMTNCET
jgi:hypothetical protein